MEKTDALMFCLVVILVWPTCVVIISVIYLIKDCRSQSFVQNRSDSSANASLTEVSQTPTKQICSLVCLSKDWCNQFDHDETTGICTLSNIACYAGIGTKDYFVKRNTVLNTMLAQGKLASMSSTYGANQASRGNDGHYPTSDIGFHTECNDYGPWWRVDLQDAYCVTAVYFMNRGYNSAWDRAKNIMATVSLLEADIMDNGYICGYIDGAAEQFNNTITCDYPMTGRFVQLQLLDTTCLHFYEVEVHGY